MNCEELYERLTELAEGSPARGRLRGGRSPPGGVRGLHSSSARTCKTWRDCAESRRRPTTMPEELRGRIAQMLASPDPRRPAV